jgi:hypothetical protein
LFSLSYPQEMLFVMESKTSFKNFETGKLG